MSDSCNLQCLNLKLVSQQFRSPRCSMMHSLYFRSIQAESRLSGLRTSISRPTLSERILQFLRAQDQQDSVQASSSFLFSYRHDKQRQTLKLKLLGLLWLKDKLIRTSSNKGLEIKNPISLQEMFGFFISTLSTQTYKLKAKPTWSCIQYNTKN